MLSERTEEPASIRLDGGIYMLSKHAAAQQLISCMACRLTLAVPFSPLNVCLVAHAASYGAGQEAGPCLSVRVEGDFRRNANVG